MRRTLLLILLLACAAPAAEPGFKEIYAGFHSAFPTGRNRTGLKQRAFEAALSRSGVASAIRHMRSFELALDAIRDRIDDDFAAYMKQSDKWWAWRRKHERDHQRKYKRPPADYPVPQGLNKAYIDSELDYRESRSLKLRERLFHAWVEERIARRLAELGPRAEGRPLQALVGGLKDKNAYQRLRCARLLGRMGGTKAVEALDRLLPKSGSPAVASAMLQARARASTDGVEAVAAPFLDHADWPVRAGAVLALRAAGTPAAKALMETRRKKEQGRLRDDLADALDNPVAWREPPEGTAQVAGVPGTGSTEFLGIATSSRAVIYCIDASVPQLWEQVRQETIASLASLPDGALFGLVVFAGDVHVFKKKLTAANAGTRKTAADFLGRIEADPAADAYAGLMRALDLAGGGRTAPPAADTLFFFCLRPPRPIQTDLDRRRFVDPRQVTYEIRHRNALLGLRIHCVGTSAGGESWWLQTLAKQFRGTHLGLRG